MALAAPPEVTYLAVLARAREVSERLRQLTLQRIQASGVRLVVGTARLEAGHTVAARAADGGETRLDAERVIIATGSSPLRPAGVPFDDARVFDSETITQIASKPRELLIVGGGAIGAEYATIFSALGVPVTILDAADRLVAMMDGEISRRLEQVFLAREPDDPGHRHGLGAARRRRSGRAAGR